MLASGAPLERAEPRELPTFDGWRGIAIILVLIAHFSLNGPPSLVKTLMAFGLHGVDVFFGISGFLICNRLLSEERRYGSVSIRGFYTRRVFRILPVFLLYLFLVACFPPIDWESWRAALLFYRNYIVSPEWSTRHFWSLAVEEHFYLIMPLLFVIARPRRLTAFLSVATLVSLWSIVDAKFQLTPVVEMRFRTDYRMPALLCGCAAAIIFANFRPALKRIPKPEITVTLLSLIFVALILVPKPLRFALQAPLVPAMLISTALYPTSWISRMLQIRPLAWIGKVSYGLYVWQEFFLTPGTNVLWMQRFPVNLLVLSVVVAVSYFWIEIPLMNLGRRLSRRTQAPPEAGTLDQALSHSESPS
jgi:peptidoglycan/LPS O-acetylase OafA/YrhL